MCHCIFGFDGFGFGMFSIVVLHLFGLHSHLMHNLIWVSVLCHALWMFALNSAEWGVCRILSHTIECGYIGRLCDHKTTLECIRRLSWNCFRSLEDLVSVGFRRQKQIK